MKLRIAVLCIGILIPLFSLAQGGNVEIVKESGVAEEGILFSHEAWVDILKKAKAENRMIFLDCYTTWCGPCKMIAKTVFKDPKVGLLMNSQFINVKMDMEKGDGIDLQLKFNVKYFPTLLFINPNGEVEHRLVGAISSGNLIKGANDALLGKGLNSYLKKYKSGVRDTTFLKEYIQITMNASMEGESKIGVVDLFAVAGMEYMHTSSGWKVFSSSVKDPYSDLFLYFLRNMSLIASKVGKKKVDDKFVNVCIAHAKKFIKKHEGKSEFDEGGFNKFLEFIKSKGVNNVEDAKFYALLEVHFNTGNFGGFADLIDERLNIKNEFTLININKCSKAVAQWCADPNIRLRAVKWVELGITIASESESTKVMVGELSMLKEELKGVKK